MTYVHDCASGSGKYNEEDIVEEISLADKTIDSVFLWYARYYPLDYLRIVGQLLVMSELIALLTPAIAMGIQWVTALCDGPPVLAIIDLIIMSYNCALEPASCDLARSKLTNCILKPTKVHSGWQYQAQNG